jgi:hypothetical protein
MKSRNKRRAARRYKASARPTVIHINGLYLAPEPDDGSLLDFCRMITRAVGPENKGDAI